MHRTIVILAACLLVICSGCGSGADKGANKGKERPVPAASPSPTK